MRQEPKLFSSDRGTPPPPQDGFRVEPRNAPRARYDEDDDDRPRRRRGGFPWKLVIVLVVLAAVAYGGWKVWGMFGQQVAGSGEVPLFTASVDPFKHRPDDPGGIVVPYEDSTVFGGTIGNAEQGDELEVLLPEPEEPVAMQPDEAAAPEEGVIDVGAAPVGDIEAPEEGAEALFSADQIDALVDQAMNAGEGALPLPQEKPAAPAAPETTISVVEEEAVTTTAETAAPASGGTGTLSLDDIAASLGVSGNAPSAPATETTTNTGEATTQAPAAEESTSAAVQTVQPAPSEGASWVQIAAYLSRGDAEAAWQRLAANQADLLASVEARVMETTVAGTSFHRLQVGSFASAADAQRLCDALRQRQIDCMVVGP